MSERDVHQRLIIIVGLMVDCVYRCGVSTFKDLQQSNIGMEQPAK